MRTRAHDTAPPHAVRDRQAGRTRGRTRCSCRQHAAYSLQSQPGLQVIDPLTTHDHQQRHPGSRHHGRPHQPRHQLRDQLRHSSRPRPAALRTALRRSRPLIRHQNQEHQGRRRRPPATRGCTAVPRDASGPVHVLDRTALARLARTGPGRMITHPGPVLWVLYGRSPFLIDLASSARSGRLYKVDFIRSSTTIPP